MAVVTLKHSVTGEMIKLDAPDSGFSIEYLRAGWDVTDEPFRSDDPLADSSGEAPVLDEDEPADAPESDTSLDLPSDEPAEPADIPPAVPAATEGN